jgi:hypothetical protein
MIYFPVLTTIDAASKHMLTENNDIWGKNLLFSVNTMWSPYV